MRKYIFCIIASAIVSGCSTQMINDSQYNRPAIGYGVNFPHCNTRHENFWNYVANYQNGPGFIEIDYRRPINASAIYRGDCNGDRHSCDSVAYIITDVHGNKVSYRANEFDPGEKVNIKGTRIRHLKMEGAITGRGVDRQSGPVISCPM